MPTLVLPAVAYRDSYLAATREFVAEGRYRQIDLAQLRADFPGFVALLRGQREADNVSSGRVAETVLWLVDGSEYLGRVSIRHTLNDWLWRIGGHIGYEIRPSCRRRGYGTLILRLALPYTRDLGLPRALVTCDADNVGSRRIIEANGGRFENAVIEPGRGVRKLRYWIDLSDAAASPQDTGDHEVIDG